MLTLVLVAGFAPGDVIYARFFSTPVLVLNSVDACRALMDKRGAKYSGRPPFTFHNEMCVPSLSPPLLVARADDGCCVASSGATWC